MPGVPLQNDWSDIGPVQGGEDLHYDTQKPQALLERLIKASSNEGDTVLDAYCGCGTTVAVAQRLNRRWIGIDVTFQSISVILKRFADTYGEEWPAIEANIVFDAIPQDVDSAKKLANKKEDKLRKEFEKWAILTFCNHKARINEQKGADGGIDGIVHFAIDSAKNATAIFQAKSGKVDRKDMAALNSDRQKIGAEIGYMIAFEKPTLAMRGEIAAAGKYKHPHYDVEYDRLQWVTVEEIVPPLKRRLNLPMPRDAVKKAEVIGDADRQVPLL